MAAVLLTFFLIIAFAVVGVLFLVGVAVQLVRAMFGISSDNQGSKK